MSRKITYSSKPSHAARSAHARGEKQFRTYDTSHIRPKKSKAPLIVGALLALIVLGLAAWGGSTLLKSCSTELLSESESVEIVVPEGAGVKAIGTLLQDARLIANSNEFVSRVDDLGAASELKPGSYALNGGMDIDQIIAALRAGPDGEEATLTIPEGFTLEAVATRVAEVYEGSISEEDFLAAARNAAAYEEEFPFVAGAYNNTLEGFLFPKTYPVKEDDSADSLIRMMLSQYQTEVSTLDYSYAQEQGLTQYDVLKLASIIEKEASSDFEIRAKVSSVFYNRLAVPMNLQSDATTAYVVGRDPLPEDIDNDTSPYSTYNNEGLPAGPICSPGLECLKAACAPEASAYLYFYFKEVDGEMQYFFNETYDGHLEVINS